jgi:hypothetical protein
MLPGVAKGLVVVVVVILSGRVVDGPPTAFDVAEVVVSADGSFSLVLPDLAEDASLESPVFPSELRFYARDAATGNFLFDLVPDKIAIRDLPAALVLSTAPR